MWRETGPLKMPTLKCLAQRGSKSPARALYARRDFRCLAREAPRRARAKNQKLSKMGNFLQIWPQFFGISKSLLFQYLFRRNRAFSMNLENRYRKSTKNMTQKWTPPLGPPTLLNMKHGNSKRLGIGCHIWSVFVKIAPFRASL